MTPDMTLCTAWPCSLAAPSKIRKQAVSKEAKEEEEGGHEHGEEGEEEQEVREEEERRLALAARLT